MLFLTKGTGILPGREKAERLIAVGDNAALEHSRAFTLLLHKHTMSHRTVEEKDGRRVSSTALGKRKSTGPWPGGLLVPMDAGTCSKQGWTNKSRVHQ